MRFFSGRFADAHIAVAVARHDDLTRAINGDGVEFGPVGHDSAPGAALQIEQDEIAFDVPRIARSNRCENELPAAVCGDARAIIGLSVEVAALAGRHVPRMYSA